MFNPDRMFSTSNKEDNKSARIPTEYERERI
ncbi:hypothetical protein TNCT_573061, partial [Trichonephila clavata]